MSLPCVLSRVRSKATIAALRPHGGNAVAAFRMLSSAAKAAKPDMALIRELREASGAPIVDCKNALAAEGVDGNIGLAFQWLRKRGIAKATSMADRSANEGLIGLLVDGSRGALVEVNSETDFVARNARFQDFVGKVLAVALEKAAGAPQDDGRGASRALDVEELLKAKQPESGEVLADSLAHLVGAIRENISVSRAQVVSLGHGQGVVTGYVHGAVGPGMGKNAALVALSFDPASEAKHSDDAHEALEAGGRSLAMHVVAARPAFLDEASAPECALEKEKKILLDQARESGKDPKILGRMVEGRMRKYFEDNALVRQSHMVVEGNPRVGDYLRDLGEGVGGTVTLKGFARLSVGEREGGFE